jgi:hypothetical protein
MARPTALSLLKCAFIILLLGIFVGVAAGLFSSSSQAQAKPDAGAVKPATQTPAPAAPAEKPAEEVYKNIQVLKGMPAGQLMMAMNFMRASLGVNCAFCHVQNGNDWDFAKDEKRPKATARKMIQMVMGINKDSFGGQTRVSCFTCHRGNEHTNGMPPLPQIAPEGGPGGAEPATTSGGGPAPPTADQLFDKFVEAVGGRAALEKAKTRVSKATQTTTDGRATNLEIAQAPPNKILLTATSPQGTQTRGYDGAKGWMQGPRGVAELSGDPLNQLLRWADFNWPLTLKSRFTATRLGQEKIGDREVYVVTGQLSDTKRERLYFDVQTGLLMRDVVLEQSLIGNIPSQVDYEDYRDVGGVKLPFTVRLSLVDPWSSWTRKYSEIKADVPVDEKKFAMPAAATLPAKP